VDLTDLVLRTGIREHVRQIEAIYGSITFPE
jgi:hypothetical protein